jgi:hypothetical protein
MVSVQRGYGGGIVRGGPGLTTFSSPLRMPL